MQISFILRNQQIWRIGVDLLHFMSLKWNPQWPMICLVILCVHQNIYHFCCKLQIYPCILWHICTGRYLHKSYRYHHLNMVHCHMGPQYTPLLPWQQKHLTGEWVSALEKVRIELQLLEEKTISFYMFGFSGSLFHFFTAQEKTIVSYWYVRHLQCHLKWGRLGQSLSLIQCQ